MENLPRFPNVLVVIVDDHQADAVGALGNRAVKTPVLDRLVSEGTAFVRTGIMGSLMPAVCAPSRACVLTGQTLFAADANPALERGPEFQVQLPADAVTLPQRFGEAGYQTFLSGKWHNDLPALLRSFERGEAIFHGGMCDHTRVPVRDIDQIRNGLSPETAAGFSTEIFFGAAEKFLRTRDRDRPFFAWIALTSPHDPRTPPAEFRHLYEAAQLPLPSNFRPDHPFDNGELDVRDELLMQRPLDPSALQEELADYYGMISHHDHHLGRMLEVLREQGDEENTLVVYLSDHGLALGRHGLVGKQNLYNHSIRVPFIIRGPGVPAGERRTQLAYSLDLYATLCALAGLPAPDDLESRSLVPALRHSSDPIRDTLCCAYMDCQRMVTDGRWKLIAYRVSDHERFQLFDLQDDPGELQDLSSSTSHQAIIRRLLTTLRDWQNAVGDHWMTLPSMSVCSDSPPVV